MKTVIFPVVTQDSLEVNPTFRGNISSLSSGLKSKRSEKPGGTPNENTVIVFLDIIHGLVAF
jgi:hypothetical protein